jgi:hypothetical protein
MLIAGIVTAALALLVLAPLASAASDPVGSGSATVNLNNGFLKGLKKKGVKTSAVSPGKLKGAKLTLNVTGGSIDPTTGKGTVNLGGGLKFKAGKKSTTVKRLVLNVTKGPLGAKLTATVGGKNAVFANVVGFKSSRNGFGVNLTIKQLKLSGKAASQLNKKLGLKGKKAAFKGNKVMGSAKAGVEPSTVTILPGGTMSFTPNATTIGKLTDPKVGVKITKVAPTEEPNPGEFGFPISGGNIAPAGNAGKVESSGGLTLTQDFGPTAKTTINLGNFAIDLSTKTVGVAVTATSTASEKLNLPATTTSIADITTPGTISSDATAHKVTVQGAGASLQELTVVFLNGFVQIAEGGFFQKRVAEKIGEGKTKAEAEAEAGPEAKALYANSYLKTGDALGTFSFAAQTQ